MQDWLTWIGTALAAGIAGQAILLAIMNAKRADALAKDVAQTDEAMLAAASADIERLAKN